MAYMPISDPTAAAAALIQASVAARVALEVGLLSPSLMSSDRFEDRDLKLS